MQLLHFSIVGVLGTTVHFFVLYTLVRLGVSPLASTTIGAISGAVLNYLLSYYLVFRSRRAHYKALPRFLLIAAIGWGLNGVLFQGLYVYSEIPLWVAQFITTGIVLFWNFSGNRIVTFGSHHDE
jgi:putative flippase GtrA